MVSDNRASFRGGVGVLFFVSAVILMPAKYEADGENGRRGSHFNFLPSVTTDSRLYMYMYNVLSVALQ